MSSTTTARRLCLDDGSPLTQDVVGEYVRKAGRKVDKAALAFPQSGRLTFSETTTWFGLLCGRGARIAARRVFLADLFT